MSKYNHFAKDLDTAFKKARQEYIEAWNGLQAATKAHAATQVWRKEQYAGENALLQEVAKAKWQGAEHAFKVTESRVWKEFDRKRTELKKALEAEVNASGRVEPESIDQNGLDLLKSGILTPYDYFGLLDKYNDNPTMLRFVAKYAKETADTMDDPAGRRTLYMLCQQCRNGQGEIMRSWDALSSIADYCSGQVHGQGDAPAYIETMSRRWEELTEEIISNF